IAGHPHRDGAGGWQLFHGFATLEGHRHHFQGLARVVAERIERHRERQRLPAGGARRPPWRTRAAGGHLAKFQLEVSPFRAGGQAEGWIESKFRRAGKARPGTAGGRHSAAGSTREEHLELDRPWRPPIPEQVEAQIEVAVVVTEPDPAYGASRRMHGAKESGDIDVATGAPLLVVHDAIELGRDLADGTLRRRGLGVLHDRLVEDRRRALAV